MKRNTQNWGFWSKAQWGVAIEHQIRPSNLVVTYHIQLLLDCNFLLLSHEKLIGLTLAWRSWFLLWGRRSKKKFSTGMDVFTQSVTNTIKDDCNVCKAISSGSYSPSAKQNRVAIGHPEVWWDSIQRVREYSVLQASCTTTAKHVPETYRRMCSPEEVLEGWFPRGKVISHCLKWADGWSSPVDFY